MVLKNLNSTIISINTRCTLRHCTYGTSYPCPLKRKKVQEDERQAYIPEVRTYIAVYHCCGKINEIVVVIVLIIISQK